MSIAVTNRIYPLRYPQNTVSFTSGNKSSQRVPSGVESSVIAVPVAVLIVCCIIGMIYSGGFFSGNDFISAFSDADASVGLMLGSTVTLILTIIYYLCRRVLSFKKIMECIPEGFKSMVPAILILTFAWTLNAMTASLGADVFVANLVKDSAGAFKSFLPAESGGTSNQ